MNNLPEGFYYKDGVLINKNRTKSNLEKRVEVLEKELSDLKEYINVKFTNPEFNK